MFDNLLKSLNRNKYEIAYRGWNALTASAVAYELFNNPAASAAEYLPDIALHGIEALMPDTLPASIIIGLNVLRGAQAGASFLTGQANFPIERMSNIPFGLHGALPYISIVSAPTTIPAAANATDVINHAMNIARHLKDVTPPRTDQALMDNPKTLLLSTRPSTKYSQSNNDKTQTQHCYETRSKTKAAGFR